MLGIYFLIGKLSVTGSAPPQARGRVAKSTVNIQSHHKISVTTAEQNQAATNVSRARLGSAELTRRTQHPQQNRVTGEAP